MQRECARSPRGAAIEDIKRGSKFDRVNIIGAQRNGRYYGIECYKRNADSEFFEGWFETRLLKEIPRGSTVILDNARFHREKALRKIARGKARLLFPPPYSPDCNPIEKTWANMKRYLCNNIQDYFSVEAPIYDYLEISEY
jgi:transposase